MIRTAQPAVDSRFAPVLGATKDGQPLSYNRAPAADLAGWIGRLSVSKFDARAGYTLSCGLFPDTAGVRIQLAGDFEIETATGGQHHGRGSLFYGPQSKRMPVRVAGDFISIGVTFRPSASPAFLQGPMSAFVDRVVSVSPCLPDTLPKLFDPEASPEAWLGVIEQLFRERIADFGAFQPNPISARFEEIAFVNPAMSITQAAREIEVDRRRLERAVIRDFGLSPKQVLKRARALDMASYLRGVADGNEAAALALRYYDESHLNREFIELFGMSPRQFTALPQPLLTLNLEARQAQRLEMINRLKPGTKRPWE